MELKEKIDVNGRFGHEGKTLLILSQIYNDPYEVLKEYIQNSLDENANIIKVDIDLKAKKFSITDNGNGMSKDTIIRRCQSFALSEKSGLDKYGQKGIGNLAGLSIADGIFIISREKGVKGGNFYRLPILKKTLLNQHELKFELSRIEEFERDWNFSTRIRIEGIEKGPCRRLEKINDLYDYLISCLDSDLRKKEGVPEIRIRTNTNLHSMGDIV